jgi:cytosine permease
MANVQTERDVLAPHYGELDRLYPKPPELVEFLEKERFSEYALEPIPEDKRARWWDITIVWMGFQIWPGGYFPGLLLAPVMDLGSAVAAIIVGNLILFGVAGFYGHVGQRTGMTSYQLWKYAWGKQGFLIAMVVMWVTYMAWVAVEAGILANYWGVKTSASTEILVSFFAAILAVIPAAFGIRALSYVGYAAVPLLIGMIVWSTVKGLAFFDGPPFATTGSINWFVGLATVVGLWIVGANANADFGRWLKSTKGAWGMTAMAFLVCNMPLNFAGLFLARAVGSGDQGTVFTTLGVYWLGFVAVTLGLVTTMDANSYSGGLQLTAMVGHWFHRWQLVMVHGICAGTIAAMGIFYSFYSWLQFLSIIMPILFGVLAADVALNWRQKYLAIPYWWWTRTKWSIPAVAAFAAGAGLNTYLWFRDDAHTWVLASAPGTALTFVVYLGLAYFIRDRSFEHLAAAVGERPAVSGAPAPAGRAR